MSLPAAAAVVAIEKGLQINHAAFDCRGSRRNQPAASIRFTVHFTLLSRTNRSGFSFLSFSFFFFVRFSVYIFLMSFLHTHTHTYAPYSRFIRIRIMCTFVVTFYVFHTHTYVHVSVSPQLFFFIFRVHNIVYTCILFRIPTRGTRLKTYCCSCNLFPRT